MKRNFKTCQLALALAPSVVFAQPPLQVHDLAAAIGLSDRDVQMVVGVHTAYPQYITSYDWARRRFVKALGQERYRELMAGRQIVLDNSVKVALAVN